MVFLADHSKTALAGGAHDAVGNMGHLGGTVLSLSSVRGTGLSGRYTHVDMHDKSRCESTIPTARFHYLVSSLCIVVGNGSATLLRLQELAVCHDVTLSTGTKVY